MLNGDGEWSEFSKIFNTTDFAYREVRVERPLRLSFTMREEGFDALRVAKPFLKLPETEQEGILACLAMHMPSDMVWMDREAFLVDLNTAIKTDDIKLAAPIKKAVLTAFGERNEEAEICRDSKGRTEADSDLRDHELVPFDEDWQTYVAREVKPFVPEAWVDENHIDDKDCEVGRVGYEINFNRYFYKYVPPRSLEEIDNELRSLELEIAELLKGS